MPIIEGVSNRNSQQEYGKFRPHADQRRFRSHWAAVDGSDAGGYESGRDLESVGVAIGRTGSRLTFEQYKDPKTGQPHVISVGGRKLAEYVAPLELAQEKERREGRESTDELANFLGRNNTNRTTNGGLSGIESTLQTTLQQAGGGMGVPDTFASPPAPTATAKKVTVGWTPERRAAAGERLRAAREAKKAQSAT